MAKVSRGIRNKNPLNIRKGSAWEGISKARSNQDPDFCVFVSLEYGYRAAMCLLTNYVFFYGFDTLEKIITRWAPPEDHNDTRLYIQLCQSDQFPTSDYQLKTKADLFSLVYSMSIIESGYKPDLSLLDSSFNLLPKTFRELWTK